MTLNDIFEQVEKIDQKILLLMEQRALLCRQSNGMDADQESELVSQLVEDATEKGLDEVRMEKIGRLMTGLCRETRE